MGTEEDFRKYLWPEERILAVFFSSYLRFFYVPNSEPGRGDEGILVVTSLVPLSVWRPPAAPSQDDEGILVLTSHRVSTLKKFKGWTGIIGANPFEEVYSVPISNVSAVRMRIYEHELKDGTKAFLKLWLPAGLCLWINLPGKDVDKAQHAIATIIASEKAKQVSEDGAMAAIQSYERSKQQIP